MEPLFVQQGGKNGYAMCRIPGMVVTQKGTLLLYCEARRTQDDWAHNDILLRRSTDGGASFSENKLLCTSQPGHTVHNPVMIVKGDTVHFLWGIDYLRFFHQESHDDGLSFTAPVEITGDLEGFRQYFPWNVVAFGPGHGVVLKSGRLAVPVWFANGAYNADGRTRQHHPSVCAVCYSDDDGASWQVTEPLPTLEEMTDPNETAAALLQDGKTVLYNIRHEGKRRYRGLCRCEEGIRPRSVTLSGQLPDPVCFGSMTSGETEAGFRVYFCNCKYNGRENPDRIHLTLRQSGDEGGTWSEGLELSALGGYSDLGLSKDGKWVYAYYEKQRSPEAYELDLVLEKLPVSALE